MTNVLTCMNMSHQYAELHAYYHLKKIHCLKAFLIQETLVTVLHAFVTSRIDYFNFVLYGISDYNSNRLQLIQNSAACIVKNTRKQFFKYYITQRIHFKILLKTYKSINDMSSQKLRSSSQILLQVPVSRLK